MDSDGGPSHPYRHPTAYGTWSACSPYACACLDSMQGGKTHEPERKAYGGSPGHGKRNGP